MKEEDYARFRELFVHLSADDQFRMYKPLLEDDKKLQFDVFMSIVRFENKYGDPIKWLKKNPDDFAIYKPIMIGGHKAKPTMLRGLLLIRKWNKA